MSMSSPMNKSEAISTAITPTQSVAVSPIASQNKNKSLSPILSPNKKSPTEIQTQYEYSDGSKVVTNNNFDTQNRPEEGFSTNILVFGGPETLAKNMGPLPPGTFTKETMDSEMNIMPQQPVRNSNDKKKDSGPQAQIQPTAMATESVVATNKGPPQPQEWTYQANQALPPAQQKPK
jgi:hypothetical protein